MYSLADYARMVGDSERMKAYAAAIRELVQPGDIVVDLGTGTGVCALLAARAGAKRVYAIETNPLMRLGPALAAANGVANRIAWIEQDSRSVVLPEPADVLLADLRGVLPLYQDNFTLVADAKARFMKPGARVLPLRDQLYCAPVSTARINRALWGAFVDSPCGFDWSPAVRRARADITNDRDAPLVEADLLAVPERWATLEYGGPVPERLKGTFRFKVAQTAELDALALWFDAELTECVGFSNRPGSELVYARALLPLPHSLAVRSGEVIEANIWAHQTRDATAWSWRVRVGDFEHRTSFLEQSILDAATSGAQRHPDAQNTAQRDA